MSIVYNLIVFQTPAVWFALPSNFKQYIDEVYTYGVFFGRTGAYGCGGLLAGKQYMLSMTRNAIATYFGCVSGFLEEHSLDDVLIAFHLTQQ
ncbi:hypothetical protein GCM10027341_04470 [Spirosoma knui]